MMTTLHICHNMSYMRKQFQWTQERLAEQLGVSFQAVSKWENNLAYPDITLLPEIARLFHLTLDELLLVNLSNESRPKQVSASQPLTVLKPLQEHIEEHVHPLEQETVHNQEQATSNGEQQYSIKLFCNGSETSEFPEWAKRIEIQLSGGVNNVDSTFTIQCDVIAGNAIAGANINCNTIGGNTQAGDMLNCEIINGSASAGSNITCDTIHGNAQAGNSIQCDTIHGSATAGNQINSEQILNESYS